MTSQNEGPKEYWINIQKEESYVYSYEPTFQTEGYFVRVVKYCVVESLRLENERLKEALRMATEYILETDCRCKFDHETQKWASMCIRCSDLDSIRKLRDEP